MQKMSTVVPILKDTLREDHPQERVQYVAARTVNVPVCDVPFHQRTPL